MKFLFLVLGISFSVFSFGNKESEDSEKKLVKSARKHFLYGEYQDAIEKYEEALKINPNSSENLFELGLCYYESKIQKEKALPYFEKSILNAKADTIPELLYYLGQSHQFAQNFDEAIYYYSLFDKKINSSTDGQILRRETSHLVDMCNHGKQFLVSVNENIIIENLGGVINSSYSEYAPVIKKDGSLLIFTARKKGSTGGEFFHDNKYFEDIYVSSLKDGVWSSPKKLDESSEYASTKFNFLYHDAAIAFNSDESELYIYRDNDVWKSPLQNGKFSEPIKLNEFINTTEHEPSVYLTPNGNTLFLVSNKKGGLGGRDLYYSKKLADGTWGEVKSMGSKINTTEDDDAPFITNDGKTMYFSSKGHSSMGGYDIFKTTLDDNGNWTEPINLGVPINSPGDDIFYTEEENGNGYFSSDRAGGIGSIDIYKISYRKDDSDTILAANNNNLVIDSSQISIIEVPVITSTQFELLYDYNHLGIEKEDAKYNKFIDDLFVIAKSKGSVTLNLESSASKVPTTTFKTNHHLAKLRLEEASEKIKSDLIKKGLKKEQINIENFNAIVQGPAYNNDFDTNKEAYLNFQYFKAIAK